MRTSQSNGFTRRPSRSSRGPYQSYTVAEQAGMDQVRGRPDREPGEWSKVSTPLRNGFPGLHDDN